MGFKKKDTFDDNKQIEDATACITSTAEQMASFTFWISACSNKRTKLKFILPQMCQFLGSGYVNAYLCPTNNRKAKSASPQSFSSPWQRAGVIPVRKWPLFQISHLHLLNTIRIKFNIRQQVIATNPLMHKHACISISLWHQEDRKKSEELASVIIF